MVLVYSTLEKTVSSRYLISTEETILVVGKHAVVVRRCSGDENESEKNERWPEVKEEIIVVTRGSMVEG